METTATTRSPSRVVVAFDATKDIKESELSANINTARARSDILRKGDTLVVFGILRKVSHPLGYRSIACPEILETSIRAMQEEISRKVDKYVIILQQCAEDCKNEGICMEVKITAGVPIEDVILQEAVTCNAIILYRNLHRLDLNQPGKIVGQKRYYYMAQPVLLSNFRANENINQSGNSRNNLMPSFALKSRQHKFQSNSGSSSRPEVSCEKELQDSLRDLNLFTKESDWGFRGWFKELVALFRANSKARQMLRKEIMASH